MKLITKSISVVTALCFCVGTITSPASAQLSAPVIPVKTGIQNQINFSEIPASAGMTNGVVFSGIKIYPQEPFRFDFIMDENNPTVRVTPRGYPDTGEHRGSSLQQDDMMRLIKYFMVSLTVPEGDLWVNLSPYEPDRIVPQALGQTEMGHDLLAQDYILKQLTASLMNPEGESGKKFWERVYEKLYASLSSPNVSVGDPFSKDMSSKNNGFPTEAFGNDSFQQAIESFNKVWIVPNRVEVYQNGDVAYITHADFKVMLEEDYYAKQQSELSSQRKLGPSVVQETAKDTGFPTETFGNDNIKQIIRSTIIPLIEDEVNNGESFANLRQIFHSMILAKWYEQHFKNSVLGQNYVDHNTTSGIELEDKSAKQKIYDQYVQAYKSGVSNLIKEEYDPVTQGIVTRKYFVGGITANFAQLAVTSNLVMDSNVSVSRVSVFLKKEYPVSRSINYAMMSEKRHDMFISVLFLIFMGVILPYLEEYMLEHISPN